ncbi:juvenile hormone esterase-like [Atheta coriaria]|uniref:juvenile hormone esterase-like n=1 Tax=Dalotia coriaria TaxID=877792 RepID=UPI0031F42568
MSPEPIVTIKQGVLKGQTEKTKSGVEFNSFLGIPYAQPPIGELRFKAPQPPKPWQGIRQATKEGNICYHKDVLFELTTGSEDCLYLNVFTPKLPNVPNTEKGLPVMVWFHGGGFMSGSGRRDFYGPEFMIDKGIVLVTMNFRLGSLGFLNLKDTSLGVLGNAALKDQNMALKWVQMNIAQFGGDPNNVTIFGESSGSASVCFHIVSPMGKGLFHKAIMQSGVASCVWAEGRMDSAYKLLEKLGKKADNDTHALKLLQAAPVEDLINAQLKVPDIWKPSYLRPFCPVIEKHDKTEELFLPDYPINLLKAGKYNKVPIIIGATSGEGLIIKALELRLKTNFTPKNDADFVPHNFRLQENPDKCAQIGQQIREFYYGDQDPLYSAKSILYDYNTDAYFVRAILDVAETIMRTSKEKVFMYQFCLKTKLNMFSSLVGATGKGTCHVDDLYYLFKSELTPDVAPNSIEENGVQRMTKWWTNFAKYSDPNGLGNDPLLSVKWINSNHNEMQYLEIDKNIRLKSDYHKKYNDFWKSIESTL